MNFVYCLRYQFIFFPKFLQGLSENMGHILNGRQQELELICVPIKDGKGAGGMETITALKQLHHIPINSKGPSRS